MDTFNLDSNFVPDFSYLQELEEASFDPSVAFGSQPCMSGFSVQTLESPSPAYVSQPDAVQNNAYSVNPLNQYDVAPSTSESNFISSDNLVNFPLYELVVYLGTNETASNELSYTELNAPTDTSPLLQGESCGETSVNFSQSSWRPVAIVNPQQEAQTEAESVNPLLTSSKGKAAQARAKAKYEQSPARKAAKDKYEQSPAGKAARAKYQQSPAGKAAKDKYEQSPAGKAARAKYQQSPAGKAAQAKYQQSPAGKAAKDKYEQSPAGKAARAKYQKSYQQSPAGKAAKDKYAQSPAGKAARAKYQQSPGRKAAQAKYHQSPAGKAARAKYQQSPAGKAARAKYQQSPAGKAAHAIRAARYNAFKKELAISGNEEIARQKGEEAAERKRLSLQNTSVDQIAPPAFQSSN